MPRILDLTLVLLLIPLCLACGASAESRPASAARHQSSGSPVGEQVYAVSSTASVGGEAADAEMEMEAMPPLAPGPDQRLAQNQAPPVAPPPGGSTVDATPAEPPESSGRISEERKTKLIYKARIHLAIFETARVQDAIEKLAKDFGGYLVRRSKGLIEIRVPAERFDEALALIGKEGDVLDRNVTVEDVTEQYLDAEVRLKNARAMRDRLERLLARAGSVDEALQVERELGRVTEEIELLEGRLKLLRELVAFSTITVQLSPPPSENVDSVVELPFDWLGELGLGNLLRLR